MSTRYFKFTFIKKNAIIIVRNVDYLISLHNERRRYVLNKYLSAAMSVTDEPPVCTVSQYISCLLPARGKQLVY